MEGFPQLGDSGRTEVEGGGHNRIRDGELSRGGCGVQKGGGGKVLGGRGRTIDTILSRLSNSKTAAWAAEAGVGPGPSEPPPPSQQGTFFIEDYERKKRSTKCTFCYLFRGGSQKAQGKL